MPPPAVHLSPELLDACRRGTVLTPTERLRRALAGAYDAAMLAAGHRAWTSVDAFSVDGWLIHQHRLQRADDPRLPRLLDSTAELLLWQATAPDGHEALAPLARDAWALAWQWRLPLTRDALGTTENGRLLRRWVGRFSDALEDHAATTRVQLPELLARRLTAAAGPAPEAVPTPLCCFGFEATPAAVTAYLAALNEAGISLLQLADPGVAGADCRRVELPDPRTELSAVAQWCRQVLLSRSDARIGVVVPDLAGRLAAVERQFAAYLEPPGVPGEHRTFDVAGGRPLAEQAIWRDAMRWLRLCFHRLAAGDFGRLLASPYLSLPSLPSLPAALPDAFALTELAAASRDEAWLGLSRAAPEPPPQQPLTVWLRDFRRALLLAGWTGQGAGSVQFQARQQALELLDEAAAAPEWQTPDDPAAALAWLDRLARQRPFAPRRSAAPVQILGYLETTGLRFTHLWVTGLSDEGWPAPVRTNPLLPLSLQREHGVPRIDAPGELAFALRRLDHWQHSAPEVVLSHGVEEQGTRRTASPLTVHRPAVPVEQLIGDFRVASHPAFATAGVRLVGGSRERAGAMAAGHIAGGSRLLRDQALCPFRRWALHTLGLDLAAEPHALPDARDRGTLVHEALHRALLGSDGQPIHPEALEPERLDGVIGDTLGRQYRRFPQPLHAAEQRRLHALLGQWLELEAERAAFAVHALEHPVTVSIGGLTLSLRFDRVDRIDGALVVLDYKTGPTRPQRLFDERLTEPQLPLYALADPAIEGVLFVELGDGVALRGIGSPRVNLSPARLQPLHDDWNTVREAWRKRLTHLASEILDGRAEVAPVGPEACRACHLQPFCRIDESPDMPDQRHRPRQEPS